jgi:hypothetical protein
VRWADRKVKGGFGVMLDDIVAGLYALAVLTLCERFLVPLIVSAVPALAGGPHEVSL